MKRHIHQAALTLCCNVRHALQRRTHLAFLYQPQLTAALRDPESQQVIALEQRPVQLHDYGDGWGRVSSAFDHLANVPACPNAAAQRHIFDNPWTLELRLEEPGGRMAETSLVVTPGCRVAGEQEECFCECNRDYELGQPCPSNTVDAGVE